MLRFHSHCGFTLSLWFFKVPQLLQAAVVITACFWAEHHVRRRTRAFDGKKMTEAITSYYLRYFIISSGELIPCMIDKLNDAKAVRCLVTSCSCSRFESSKMGLPAAPLLQAAAFVPPEAMKTAFKIKHNQGTVLKYIALWRFIPAYHWKAPFSLVLCHLCRFIFFYRSSVCLEAKVPQEGATNWCHKTGKNPLRS